MNNLGSKRKFLIVVDDTPECRKSLRFACHRASKTNGKITMLRVINSGDFQHWVAVEERMRDEAKEEAEQLLERLAVEVREQWDLDVELVVSEGETYEAVLSHIESDSSIRILVLGAASGGEGPGPLVTQLVEKNVSRMPIPITVVPGFLTDTEIDKL